MCRASAAGRGKQYLAHRDYRAHGVGVFSRLRGGILIKMETPYQTNRHRRASALTLLPGVSPGFGRRGDIIFTTWPPGLESPRTRRVFRVAAFLIRNFFSVISGPLAAGAAGGKHVLALPISTRTAQFFPRSAKRGCFPAAFIGEAMPTSLGVVEAFAVANACIPARQPSLTSPRYKAISLNPITVPPGRPRTSHHRHQANT